MLTRTSQLGVALLAAALVCAFSANCAKTSARSVAAPAQTAIASTPNQAPLTAEEIGTLLDRTIFNQHRDDGQFESYERVERDIARSGGRNGRIAADKAYRVVPTGGGTLKLLVKENGTPVPAGQYQRELRVWEQILEVAIRPDDPRTKEDLRKQAKRLSDRAQLVDTIRDAYIVAWLGRETRDGRVLEKLEFDPNPNYKPRSTSADFLTHVRATVWIDRQTAQAARVEAEVIRDMSFGAGILGKVYRGGRFFYEQQEVAPGLWFMTYSQYDYSGRKFILPFEVHTQLTASHYRHIGPASKALEVAKQDLARGGSFSGDP